MNAYSPIPIRPEESIVAVLLTQWTSLTKYMESSACRKMPEDVFDVLANGQIELEREIYETPAASIQDFLSKAKLAFTRFHEGAAFDSSCFEALLADIERLESFKH